MSTLNSDFALVDVVIPAFNAERYIRSTLESAFLQGKIINSIIVVNDGSTDSTETIVQEFALDNEQPKIILINQKNGGLANARNAGIKKSLKNAKAPYIALLDADDIWLSKKLALQLHLFKISGDPLLGMVYSSYELIDANGSVITGENLIVKPVLRGNAYSSLLSGNLISGSGSGVLVKSHVFREVGLFDETLQASEDWDMWIRVCKKFHVDFVDQVLVQIRVHPSNMQKDFSRMLASELAMLNKFAIQGTHNFFLLWKIQTILYKKKMIATQIKGFENSEPWVMSQLTGYRHFFWQALLFVPAILWIPLKKVKRLFSD